MEFDVEALRAGARARAAARPRGPELAAVEDLAAPVGARHYRPVPEPRPLLVFLHGGLWLSGDLDTHDALCRRLAASAGIEVLAVDYRLAPEHPYPAAVQDAVAAVRWARERNRRVAIGGDSAGGCVAALACLALRDAGEPAPVLQFLVCPNTDLTGAAALAAAHASGFGLEAADVRRAAALWAPGERGPLHAGELSGLPPALLFTAEHDPLRDEGEAYGERLAAAGVPVTQFRVQGAPHGFLQTPGAADERLLRELRRSLRGAVRGDWRTEPWTASRPLRYGRRLDAGRAHALLRGSVPAEMEDKWFVFSEGEHLHFHRSWTGHAIFRLTVVPNEDGGVTLTDARVCDDPEIYTGEDPASVSALDWLVDRAA